jgi:hypothetical protein
LVEKYSDSALGCAIFKGYGSFIALLTEKKDGQNIPDQIMRMNYQQNVTATNNQDFRINWLASLNNLSFI